MKPLYLLAGCAILLSACTANIPPTPAQAAPTQCDSARAKRLIGTSAQQSDAQIKQITGANHVRRLGPNSAATMDYRQDRINLLIDPQTNTIARTSCG